MLKCHLILVLVRCVTYVGSFEHAKIVIKVIFIIIIYHLNDRNQKGTQLSFYEKFTYYVWSFVRGREKRTIYT